MTRRAIIVVCDSLRRDLVAEADAPTLATLADAGSNFIAASSVFPSTTRVSSASIATGCLPARHGLFGNTMALDEGGGLVCRSAGDPDFRARLRRATGRTLRVPTLAERLQREGALIMSNVSPGAAYFHDPDGFGYVYHRAGSYGPGGHALPDREQLEIALGAEGDAAMTERFCAAVSAPKPPAIAVLWLSEPDHTGHASALGSPEHRRAIASADRCVARVLETVAQCERGGDEILMIVCSDHGMETTARTIDVTAELVAAGLKAAPDSSDVVVAPNGTSAVIYVAHTARGQIAALRAFVARRDWCGAVFSGVELGTIGLAASEAIGLAVSLRGSARANQFGVAGEADIVADPESDKDYTGFGQHGGLGPHEQSPFLFLRGGGFASRRRTAVPASLVDLAPTILRHLGQGWDGLDGHPLPLDSGA
jgi:arylsulfatase A-like enzyme